MGDNVAERKGLLEVHIAVLLFGLSGLIGKLIQQQALIVVFGRAVFAALFLAILLKIRKKSIVLHDKKSYGYFIGLGVLLAFHWVSFFLGIKLSTVAIGLLMFSTFPVFVTFIEPLFFKEKISVKDLIIALITFGGVAFVMPNFEFQNTMTQGAMWGIASGFSFAILSVLNKKYVRDYDGRVISFYQNSVAAIVLLPFALYIKPSIGQNDLILIILLGVVFTGIAHTLFITSLKHVKAQTASIIASLEPVYGIIASAIILHSIPSVKELIGGSVILIMATYSSLAKK
ncbi:MAG: DMT family transporter [Tissierellales bacterium]|nr:DMT family transporter [Tissierellales bacterium]